MFLESIRHGLAERTAVASAPREVRVLVRGGYLPDTIHAEAGAPLRLLFLREESAACSEQVVFPAFGKTATLPQGQEVAVDLLPQQAGEYAFTCGMGMLHGRLLVASANGARHEHDNGDH